MTTTNVITEIEAELADFQPDDRAKAGEEIVTYLRKLRVLRSALDAGEQDIKDGKLSSLEKIDARMNKLRSQYAG